jgi:perosamine synthetase
MSQNSLALLGGNKAVPNSLKPYKSLSDDEVFAASEVVKSGVLSQFLGCWEPDFYGGPKVQEFERKCEEYFGVKHAVTVNSWTSGLIAAVGAIGIEPGDEVIVSPWTMCASATAILHWNAIPIFADIEPETFNLDPQSVEANITAHTRAIMAVDIFGHSADMDALVKIAQKYKLKIISDSAQAPGAFYKGKYTGTIADVGGYSLNYHKHIHTGEGGILVTDDADIAERLQLIRNHAEAVVGPKGVTNLCNMLGYNFRLGEIECAIGIEQLKKLDQLVHSRQHAASRLTKTLKDLSGLYPPTVMQDCTHVYYAYPIRLNSTEVGVSRDCLYKALQAEGVPIGKSYQNLHLLPMYQKKIAYGSKGFPWTAEFSRQDIDYGKGICPVAEGFQDDNYLSLGICMYEMSDSEVDQIVDAFLKVWKNLDKLQNLA